MPRERLTGPMKIGRVREGSLGSVNTNNIQKSDCTNDSEIRPREGSPALSRLFRITPPSSTDRNLPHRWP